MNHQKGENNLYKDFFCLFTDDYGLVKLSAGSCSVSVWEQIYIKEGVKEGFVEKWTAATTVIEETLPLLSLFPALPALPKHLAWRGEGTETPVPIMWPSIFFLLSLSCLGWKLCLRIFCSIWVGSKCLSKSRAEAPSRAAQFDLLVLKSQRDISVHLESWISQQCHSRYLIKTEMNTLYIMCKY